MVKKYRALLLTVLASSIWFPLSSSQGAVVTLFPSADAEIRQNSVSYNGGTNISVASGKTGDLNNEALRRALLRFDLSSIPSQARVSDARVELTVTKVPNDDIAGTGPVSSFFDLRPLLKNWNELEVTWLRATSASNWTSAGVTDPDELSTNASASTFVQGLGVYTFANDTQLIADVQSWVNNPGTNFGWLLISQDELNPKTARQFGAREGVNRPRLIVEYSLPPVGERPLLSDVRKVGSEFQFVFTAIPGLAYTVEKRASIATGPWVFHRAITPQNVRTNILVTDVLTGDMQFYRVRSP